MQLFRRAQKVGEGNALVRQEKGHARAAFQRKREAKETVALYDSGVKNVLVHITDGLLAVGSEECAGRGRVLGKLACPHGLQIDRVDQHNHRSRRKLQSVGRDPNLVMRVRGYPVRDQLFCFFCTEFHGIRFGTVNVGKTFEIMRTEMDVIPHPDRIRQLESAALVVIRKRFQHRAADAVQFRKVPAAEKS